MQLVIKVDVAEEFIREAIANGWLTEIIDGLDDFFQEHDELKELYVRQAEVY